MPSSIDRFVADSYLEREYGLEFNSPTCTEAERYYRRILQIEGQRAPGIIVNYDNRIAAGLYVAEVSRANEWVEGEEPVTTNATVLVKNPYRKPLLYGQVNALVLSRGYVLIAEPKDSGFAVRRPIMGKDYDGIHYQIELKKGVETLVRRLPQGYMAPAWKG